MHFHKEIIKDRQDELLRAAARHRLAAEVRQDRTADTDRPTATATQRLVRLLLRRVPA
jgi:hypothetical protein